MRELNFEVQRDVGSGVTVRVRMSAVVTDEDEAHEAGAWFGRVEKAAVEGYTQGAADE